MINHNDNMYGMEPTAQRVIYAASKDANWLAKVRQSATAENYRLKTSPSITALIGQHVPGEDIACVLLDYDPRIQQWSSIEQLMGDKGVVAPIVLVLNEAAGHGAADAIARIAHVTAFSSMEVREIVQSIRDAIELESLVSHQFDVVRCHRLFERLPERQRKIVQYVVEGAPNKQIATRLKVSIKTIERERQKAYRQLGVRSTAEMTRVVILGGLYDVIFPESNQGQAEFRIDTPSPSSAPVVAKPAMYSAFSESSSL